jgi:O-antigen/teichoic acid export membrane protein
MGADRVVAAADDGAGLEQLNGPSASISAANTRRVLGRSSLLTVVEVISAAGQFAISWGVARVMGVDALGVYGLVTSLTYLVQNTLMAGLEPLVMLGVVRGEKALARSAGTALLGTTALGIFLAALMIGVTGLLGYPSYVVVAIVVAALSLVPELIRSTVEWTAVSLDKVRYVLFIRAGASGLQLALGGAVLLTIQTLPELFGVFTLVSTVAAAISLWLLARWVRPARLQTGRDELAGWLRSIWPFVGFGAFGALSRRLDVPLLTQFAGLGAAGIYTAAFKVVRLFVLPRPAVFRGFFPSFVRQFDGGTGQGLSMARTLARLLSVVLGLSAVFTVGVAAPLVGLLYGTDFLPSARVLQVMIWGVPAFFVQSLAAGVLFANRQQKDAARVHAVNLVFEVGLSLALVPRLGAVGMATVYALVRLLGVGQMWRMLRKQRVDLRLGRGFLGPMCLAVALSAVTIIVTDAVSPIWQVGAAATAAVVYAFLTLVAGFVGREDWELVVRALKRRSSSSDLVSETT